MTLTRAELAAASCRALPVSWWFPERDQGESNHARLAVSICAGCPSRAACLTSALEAGEEYGIHGGAGEARRRALRMAERRGELDEALAAHWAALDGDRVALLPSFGDGATHGRRSTFNRGCRCDPCSMAASLDGVVAKLGHKRRRATAGVVAA